MKKKITMIAILLLVLALLGACSRENTDSGKLKVVTTIFPVYDWAKEILGSELDNTELTILLDNGADLHSYQPTVDDIVTISTCDVFIYIGGESDAWVEGVLKEATNKDLIAINLMDALGDAAKEEELVEGMQSSEHEHEEGEEHEHEEEAEYDEHIWLSLRNAATLCDVIAAALKQADEANAAAYTANAAAYIAKLTALDALYTKTVEEASVKTLLFGDRFPFRYFTDDYNITYYAAFIGCSAETEASFETITFLAGKVDELGLKSIMIIDSSDGRIAETIKKSTTSKDQQILTLDSMQSKTAKDIAEGTSYLSVMEANLEVLKQALK